MSIQVVGLGHWLVPASYWISQIGQKISWRLRGIVCGFFVLVWINYDYVRTQNVCAFIDWYPPLWSKLQLPCRSHERAGRQAMFVLPRWSVRSNQPNCRHTEGRRVSSRTTDRIFALTTKSEEFVWNMLNTNLWRVSVRVWGYVEDMYTQVYYVCVS